MAKDKEQLSTRVPFRHIVYYGTQKPPEHSSFVTNISETGVCIKTNTVYPPGTNLYLRIETSTKSYEAEGVVVWAKKVPPSLVRSMVNGMGIKFTTVDDGLIDLYKNKL